MKLSDAAKLGGAHYDAGRYAEAETIYRQIVEARPTAYYVLDPSDGNHPIRQKFIAEARGTDPA
jgi:hypothetical protein